MSTLPFVRSLPRLATAGAARLRAGAINPYVAIEWLAYWMACHPRLRRVIAVCAAVEFAALWSVIAAPPAFAASLASAMNWTGITDSTGAPLGDYYLSVISTSEAISNTTDDLGFNPGTWIPWMADVMSTAVSHETVTWVLKAQAALYVVVMALALWLLRFAITGQWLSWLAEWFQPLFATIQKLLNDLWVVPICLLIGLALAGWKIFFEHQRGRGWGMVIVTFIVGIVGIVLTRDPLKQVGGEDGMLATARTTGFQVAQAAFGNGPFGSGTVDDQANRFISEIATATVRHPFQLFNFGTVIDTHSGCGAAWNAALRQGNPSGPVRAMEKCGYPRAYEYAQALDGTNVALGGIFFLLGAVFVAFIIYVAYSHVLLGAATFLNVTISLFTAPAAMIAGRPRQRAWRRLKLILRQALLVFAYILYLSVAAMLILHTTKSGGLAAKVGIDHPVPKMLLTALVCTGAILLFRWLKKELGDESFGQLKSVYDKTVDAGRSGAARAKDSVGRAAGSGAQILDKIGRGKRGDDDGDDDSSPLGSPVQGRPAGGNPVRSTRSPDPASGAEAPPAANPAPASGAGTSASGATAAGAAGASGAAAGGSAAAAGAGAAVPHVAVAMAVAQQVQSAKGASSGADRRAAAEPTTGQPAPAAGRQPSGTRSAGRGQHNPDQLPIIDAEVVEPPDPVRGRE